MDKQPEILPALRMRKWSKVELGWTGVTGWKRVQWLDSWVMLRMKGAMFGVFARNWHSIIGNAVMLEYKVVRHEEQWKFTIYIL